MEDDSVAPPPPPGVRFVDSPPPPPPGVKFVEPKAEMSPLERAYTYTGIPGAIESVKGLAKGAASTVFHGGDMVRRGLGMERVINRPEVQEGMTPTNPAQNLGFGVEQAAEFLIPGGTIKRGTQILSKVPAAARIAGKAIAEGIGAGSVAGVQSGGDPAAIRNAAVMGAGTSGAIGAAGEMLPSGKKLAQRLYQSALKPAPSLDPIEREAIIRTGLREGVVLNNDVVANVQKRIADINAKISEEIAARAEAGATVDPVKVAGYADRSAKRFAEQVNPDADLAAIGGVRKEFLQNNSTKAPFTKIRPGSEEELGRFVPDGEGVTVTPRPIPLDEAQRMKQGTYRKLKDSYGEQASAAREGQKDLARGLKDGIVEAFPEIANLNQNESALIALEGSLERFAGREGNHQLIGLGTPLVLAATHSIAPTFLKAALDNPNIKSRLAIALARASEKQSQGIVSNVAPKLAAYMSNDAPPPMTQPPPFQRQQNRPAPLTRAPGAPQ